MTNLVHQIIKQQRLVLLVIVIITAILSVGLSQLTLSTNDSKLINISNKPLSKRDQPTDEEKIRILISDPSLLTKKQNLVFIKKLQDQVEKIAGVSKVTSILTLPNLRNYFVTNKMQPIASAAHTSPEEISKMQDALKYNKLYQKRAINPELTTTIISATISPQKNEISQYEIRDKIENIINKYKPHFQYIYQVGSVELSYEMRRDTLRDITLLSGIAIVVLVGLFAFFFQKLIYGLLPFITSSLALIWTLGILSYLKITLNAFSGLAIVITFAIGVMECAHFIHAYQHNRQSKEKDDHETRLRSMFKIVFIPIFFAALTTILGFFLNITSQSMAVRDTGIIICLSIAINTLLICTLTLILLNSFSSEPSREKRFHQFFLIIYSIISRINNYPKTVFLSIFILISLAIYSAVHINLEIVPQSSFYQDSPVMKNLNLTRKLITGIDYLTINVHAKQIGAFTQKANLQKLFNTEEKINQINTTSSTLSIATTTAALYQLYLDGRGDEFYKIPDRQMVIDEINKELAKKEEFKDTVKNQGRDVSIFVIYNIITTKQFDAYQKQLKHILNQFFSNGKFSYEIDSYYNKTRKVLFQIYKMQLLSLILIYLTVFLVMWYLFKSIKAGLISLIPNTLPICLVMIVLCFLKLPIFGLTIIALAAVVGLAVDDTLHLMCAYKKAFIATRDSEIAVKNALEAQVRPVSIASISLVLGMLVLCFSLAKAIMLFGAILAGGALGAWLTDLIITPFLLNKVNITKNL